ncbi:MAG: hypothetical protein ABIG84_04895 [archaeon]
MNHEEVEKGWIENNGYLAVIYGTEEQTQTIDFKQGCINDYFNEQSEEVIKALFGGGDVAGCIDERLDLHRHGYPGTFITYIKHYGLDKGLKGQAAIDAGLGAAEAFLLNRKKTGKEYNKLTTHDLCGANANIYNLLVKSDKSIKESYEKRAEELQDEVVEGITPADAFGYDFVSKLAHKTNADHEHIPYEDMIKTENHLTRIVYLLDEDCDGLNPHMNETLYPGFVLNYSNDKQTIEDLMLAMDIIRGDHGFGNKIGPDNPILVVPVYTNQANRFKFLDNMPEQYRNMMFTDEIILPQGLDIYA